MYPQWVKSQWVTLKLKRLILHTLLWILKNILGRKNNYFLVYLA